VNGHLLPHDTGWVEDKVLMADLSRLNAEVARYVLRQLDVNAGRAEQISVEDEHALGMRLVELGEAVQARAVHREQRGQQPRDTSSAGGTGLLVVESEGPQPRALEPSSETDSERP
jgi:hypothetical protein